MTTGTYVSKKHLIDLETWPWWTNVPNFKDDFALKSLSDVRVLLASLCIRSESAGLL